MTNGQSCCPYDGFELNFEIDFDHPAINKDFQHAQLQFSTQNFIEQLSSARTFGFLRDIEALRQNNFGARWQYGQCDCY